MHSKLIHKSKDIKFAADTMLGKLAKELRLLGFDTLYFQRIQKPVLVQLAFNEFRILLTKDKNLIKRKDTGPNLLITGNYPNEQLKQVVIFFNLDIKSSRYSRCILCNGILETASKNSVKEVVPAYIFNMHDEFKKCSICDRIFWHGSHIKHADERLDLIFRQDNHFLL